MTEVNIPRLKFVKNSLVVFQLIGLTTTIYLMGIYTKELSDVNNKIDVNDPGVSLISFYEKILYITIASMVVFITLTIVLFLAVIKDRKFLLIWTFTLLCIIGFFIVCGFYDLARLRAYVSEEAKGNCGDQAVTCRQSNISSKINQDFNMKKILIIQLLFGSLSVLFWIMTLVGVILEKKLILYAHFGILALSSVGKVIMSAMDIWHNPMVWISELDQIAVAGILVVGAALVYAFIKLTQRKKTIPQIMFDNNSNEFNI